MKYEHIVRLHLKPHIGRMALPQLGPHHVQALYRRLVEGGLAPLTVRGVHQVLHHALQDAVRWRLLSTNVSSLAAKPRVPHREMATMSADEVRRFLAQLAGDRLAALYVVALTTGMRQGELLALRWREVDLDTAVLRVVGSLQRGPTGLEVLAPKTPRSRRQVALTSLAVDALRGHRKAQLEERLKCGGEWVDGDFVFTSTRGTAVDAQELRKWYRQHLRRAGLRRLRFHDLRHTAATLMLSRGVHPKVASEMLGHSTVAITLDLYSHVTETMQREAARTLDELLRDM
jgi:integrase